MHILVLDTIHGGKELRAAYMAAGHSADAVDVYRYTTPVELWEAAHRHYDLVAAPVHLDPDYPLLRSCTVPVITHHEAVRRLLGEHLPHPMIEITGAQGKTTTAHALAHLLGGTGILHTSAGTYAYPAKELLWKKSITPASMLSAAGAAARMPGWLVCEVSLGVTGAGDLAIITSPDDYAFAGGKKRAIREKAESAVHARQVLVADGVPCSGNNVVRVSDIARCDGMTCTVRLEGITHILSNPLFLILPYRIPLMLAAAAAMILRVSPAPLENFTALPGRMSQSRTGGLLIIDNANSGTNAETTVCAARYARHLTRERDLTLVIGLAERDGAVCEGFPPEEILSAIDRVHPARVVWVGRYPDPGTALSESLKGKVDAVCSTLREGRDTAVRMAGRGPVVLSVKTWR